MTRPRVLLDVPMPAFVEALFTPHVELVPWSALTDHDGPLGDVQAVLSFAHTPVAEAELGQLPRDHPLLARLRGQELPYCCTGDLQRP